MKVNKLSIRSWSSLLVLLLMISCGSGEFEDPPMSQLEETAWQVGTWVYQRGISIQGTSKPYADAPDLRTFVISTSGPGSLGDFSGSSITGYIYEYGEGAYEVVSEEIFLEKGHTGKFVTFNCAVGIATTTGSSHYGTGDAGEKLEIQIRDSDYVITVQEEITLNKEQDINGGVEGAKSSYAFKANSIF